MIVSRQRRVLFVHVQKTGGSSIDRVLLEHLPGARRINRLPDDRHVTWQTAVEHRPRFATFFAFGFVRNPWARMDSWFRMIQRRAEAAAADPDGYAAQMIRKLDFWSDVIEHHPTFESFVLEGPDRIPRLRRPQLDYLRLTGPDGAETRRADFIGRTESLDDDLARVFERLELPAVPQVPRGNAAPDEDHYRTRYTPEMRDRVGAIFAPDIAEFGYDF